MLTARLRRLHHRLHRHYVSVIAHCDRALGHRLQNSAPAHLFYGASFAAKVHSALYSTSLIVSIGASDTAQVDQHLWQLVAAGMVAGALTSLASRSLPMQADYTDVTPVSSLALRPAERVMWSGTTSRRAWSWALPQAIAGLAAMWWSLRRGFCCVLWRS